MSTTQQNSAEIAYWPATQVAAAIRKRELSPVEVVNAVLERIDRHESSVNAFITVLADEARSAAKASEQEVMNRPAEELGMLHGLPVLVKDLTDTAGVRTTYGLLAATDNIPDTDGIYWGRIKRAGAVLVGKTATPPMGALTVTESELNGRTNNPWDLSRTVGGSSGGSAAAVVSGFGMLATGSDGGASIRVPSSYCGAVGLKASPGRIPPMPELSAFDSSCAVGPITRTTLDCALLFDAMSGPHPQDPFALPSPAEPFVEAAAKDLPKGLRIAFCVDGFGAVEADVVNAMRDLAKHLEGSMGIETSFVTLSLPDPFEYFYDFWTSAMGPELFEVGEELKAYPPLVEWAERARHTSVATYLDAAFERRFQIRNALQAVLDQNHYIITPTTPSVAFPHPSKELLGPPSVAGQASVIPAVDAGRFTDAPSQGNYPALTLPCGFSDEGLPFGAQIIGRANADAEVLRLAHHLEASLDLLGRVPF